MKHDSLLGYCLITFAIAFLFGLGWCLAHSTVATECKRLGAFYVGDQVYKCEVKSP